MQVKEYLRENIKEAYTINKTDAINIDKTDKNSPKAPIPDDSRLGWNEERATAWHKMQPPSKPSKSELEVYKKYINQKKEKVTQPKILILGSTVEFRELAYELGCNVTVVDFSKSYHDEISNDFADNTKEAILNSERPIFNDWCTLVNHKIIGRETSTFDIIIGDLAVGNVPPEKLDSFFDNIAKLLKKEGYLLGKSIYYYANKFPEKKELTKILDDTVKEVNCNAIKNLDEYVYAKTMYKLSIFNIKSDFEGKFGAKQIDFSSMHKQILNYVGEDENLKKIFNIYLGKETSFSSKMPEKFFIYSYIEIIKLAKKKGLSIFDIEYGTDYYKDDYPLIVFFKTENDKNKYIIPNNAIVSFLNSNGKLIDEWKASVSSRFFLIEIDRIVNNESPFVTLQKIISELQSLFKGKLSINNDLNFILSENIKYENIENETRSLVENSQLEDNPKLQTKLKRNFIYGILIYEAFIISQKNNFHANNVLILLLQELFKDNEETAKGKIWAPRESPWVAAKICICLYPLFKHFKDLNNKLNSLKSKREIKERDKLIKQIEDQAISKEYETKIKNVVESINSKNDENCDKPKMWHTEIGSDFDTSALCLEVLHLYNYYLKNKSIETTIFGILNEYVLNDKIYETFIKYPIYNSLIDQICHKQKINGEYAHKKLCGRIEWYSILYIICKDMAKKCKHCDRPTYEEPANFIAEKLRRFWVVFKDQFEVIYKETKDLEQSFIPQILYCCSKVF